MTTTMTTMTGTTSPNPVVAPAHVHDLLNRLHAQSTQQEKLIDPKVYTIQDTEEFDNIMRDQFVALDQDKCQFIYQIARMIKATQIVEAGTSFGVSTIYLALAVHQVLLASRGGDETAVSREDGRVIATEKESEKIEIARQHWKEAGDEVERFIDLREGDLLKTLRGNIFRVDLLLLDIWAPLALPTLKVVQPKLVFGSVVIVDNTISAAHRYKELLEYLRAPDSGFSCMTLPYHNGLEMCIYRPPK